MMLAFIYSNFHSGQFNGQYKFICIDAILYSIIIQFDIIYRVSLACWKLVWTLLKNLSSAITRRPVNASATVMSNVTL